MVVAECHGEERGRGKREKLQKLGKMASFFTDFGPDFLLYTPIYKRRKRDILSLMVTNIGLWYG